MGSLLKSGFPVPLASIAELLSGLWLYDILSQRSHLETLGVSFGIFSLEAASS